MALEPRVDGEGSCRGVHGGHVLHVVDVLERVLGAVVPVAIVHVLPDERVRLHRAVLVDLGAAWLGGKGGTRMSTGRAE